MHKLGKLRAMSIKVGDLIEVAGANTVVIAVKELPCGHIEIETEMFHPAIYNPIEAINLYSRY